MTFAGYCFDEEVLEEHLWSSGRRSSALGLVVRLDAYSVFGWSDRCTKCGSLAVSTSDTITPGFGVLYDEPMVCGVSWSTGEGECRNT